jgi:hypothetical protein
LLYFRQEIAPEQHRFYYGYHPKETLKRYSFLIFMMQNSNLCPVIMLFRIYVCLF